MAPATSSAPPHIPHIPECSNSPTDVAVVPLNPIGHPHNPVGASFHLIERILGRLKAIKRGHHRHAANTKTASAPDAIGQPEERDQSENKAAEPDKTDESSDQSTLDAPTTDKTDDIENGQEETNQQKRRIELADMSKLCEELGGLVQAIREVQDLALFTGTCPSGLQRRLDHDALELRSMYKEIREALHNIVRIKEQRRAVRKEHNTVTKALAKIRDQEMREMEGLITQFDKALMTRWEKLRNSMQPEAIENFLNELKGKRQALDHLSTFATQKLNQLNQSGSVSSSAPTFTPPTAPPGFTSSLLRDENKAGSSTATNRRNSISGCIRANGLRWRKHHERATRPASSSNGQENTPLSLVPLPLNTNGSNPAPPLGITIMPLSIPQPPPPPPTVTTTETSSRNSLPSSPSSAILPQTNASAPAFTEDDSNFHFPRISTNDATGHFTLAGPACSAGGLLLAPSSPVIPERRSMLHALFGELRRSADGINNTFVTLNSLTTNRNNSASGTHSTAVVVTAPEDNLNPNNGSITGSTNGQPTTTNGSTNRENQDIELFSLSRPP